MSLALQAQNGLACLLDGLTTYLHLLGIVTRQHLILADLPIDESGSNLQADGMGGFPDITPGKPGLRPSLLAQVVIIDAADATDVVCAEVTMEVGQGVDHLA